MEFSYIDRYFGLRNGQALSVRIPVGIGDDCAVITQRSGFDWLSSVDTLVEGTHFFTGTSPVDLGHKSLAVNLSDLAACGATPVACLLAITLPNAWDPARWGCSLDDWLAGFSSGFLALSAESACPLIGGDTTSVQGAGPIIITVTVFGEAPAGQALKRSGAQVDDDIWVSGTLGAAAYALACEFKQRQLPSFWDRMSSGTAPSPLSPLSCSQTLLARLHRPQARVQLGQRLLSLAHSAIDLSDGLAGDLGHILSASGVGAVLNEAFIPRPAELLSLPIDVQRQLYLRGGDDYELCFTAPVSSRELITALGVQLGVPLVTIGSITREPGLYLQPIEPLNDLQHDLNKAGPLIALNPTGYEHF